MSNNQRALTLTTTNFHDHDDDDSQSPVIRDIHALTPPQAPRWETGSRRSSALSIGSATTEGGENFTTMSREFNALVLAGSTVEHESSSSNLDRIGEEETNPLAIVRDSNPLESPRVGGDRLAINTSVNGNRNGEITVQRVKKEEVDSKISAWQNAKIAKINNRFKREDAVINGWEGEQVQKATSWMKKIEVLNQNYILINFFNNKPHIMFNKIF